MGVFEDELAIVCGFADDGEGAALAFTEGFKGGQSFGQDGHDVAFLRFVAPDLHGVHGAVFIVDVAQVEVATGFFDQFGQTVGEAACAAISWMERMGFSLPRAMHPSDHLLATALHFGVAALDGVEVGGFGLGAGSNGGGGTSAEADFHGGATELDDERGGWNVFLATCSRLRLPMPPAVIIGLW